MKKLVIWAPGPEDRFEKQWKFDPDRRRLENPIHGAAYQVVDAVDEETGRVSHEAVVGISRRAEAHVVVRENDQHLGFVLHRRYGVIDPTASETHRFFEEHPTEIPDIFSLPTGIEHLEVVQGLAGTVYEEMGEEIGLAVIEGEPFGVINHHPSMAATSHFLYAVKVGDRPSQRQRDPDEQIRRVEFFAPEAVRNIQTICGFTQGVLWRFRCWGLEQPVGSFWREIASRL